MEQVNVPESFQEALPGEVFVVSPPPGVSREHCIDAHVHVVEDIWNDGMGPQSTVFFKPSEDDLSVLKAGGLIKLQMRGMGIVPHALGTWY